MILSRRAAVSAGAFAALFPLSTSLEPRNAEAQSSATRPPSQAPELFCKDVSEYGSDKLAALAVGAQKGTASVEHYQIAARSVRLLAHHVRSVGFDPLLKKAMGRLKGSDLVSIANQGNPQSTAVTADGQTALKHLQRYDPGITGDTLRNTLSASTADLEMGRQFLEQHGAEGFYRLHAQIYETGGEIISERRGDTRPMKRHVRGAAFELRGDRPLLEYVCVTKPPTSTRKHICQYLAAGSSVATLVTTIAKVGCAADVLGSVLFDIATEGGAIVLSPVEVALCEWIEANASTLVSFTNAALSVALGCAFA